LAEIIAAKVIQSMKSTNEQEEGRLLTRAEVCARLSCSSQTLWRYAKKNLLKPIKFGGAVRYRECDVNKIAKEGTSR